MKKIIVTIIAISLLLTTSISSVNAFDSIPNEIPDMGIGGTSSSSEDYWAVIVATEKLEERTAKYFRDTLLSNGWDANNIKCLFVEEATRQNLIDAIDWVSQQDDSSDTTIIFLHGHGGKNHFICYDSAIHYKDLNMELEDLSSSATGVIIDACYSGSAIPHLQQEGRVILVSCKNTSVCYNSMASIGFTEGLSDLADIQSGVGNNNYKTSMEESYYYTLNDWPWTGPNAIRPYIQDDYAGQLEITFHDPLKGNIDQIPSKTLAISNSVINSDCSGGRWNAQSFIPTEKTLTKVRIAFAIEGGLEGSTPVTVSIREELDGSDLTSISLPASIMNKYYYAYHVFDFPDIEVIPGETYYIVCRAPEEPGGPEDQSYLVCGVWDKSGVIDYYEGGQFYVKNGGWWSPHDGTEDMCFVTYFYSENLPPNTPDQPSGPASGKSSVEYTYTTSTVDPDGDQVYYLWDWGDGTDSGWVGPYASGETGYAKHIWTEEGDYEIKVKAKDDPNDDGNLDDGLESEWSPIYSVEITTIELDLGITIKKIRFGNVNVAIKNNAEESISTVKWTISVKGGILGRINVSADGTIESLDPDMSEKVTTGFNSIVRRFGKVEVAVEVKVGSDSFEKTFYGFVLGRLFIDRTYRILNS